MGHCILGDHHKNSEKRECFVTSAVVRGSLSSSSPSEVKCARQASKKESRTRESRARENRAEIEQSAREIREQGKAECKGNHRARVIRE